MVKVYLYDRSAGDPPESAAEMLPPWRRERLARIRNEKARAECLCAGLLYACALRDNGVDPAEPVEVLPAGKPVLRDRRDVHFSLSHSGRYVLCAVSDAPVGADVQERRRVNRSIVRRFHPGERARLESVPPAAWETEFFRLWARKEAWVKAVSDADFLAIDACDVFAPLPGLYFRDETLPGEHYASVCASHEDIPPFTPVTIKMLIQ